MPATPAADYATTLANGVQTGRRVSVVIEELERRLRDELPGFLAYANEQRSLTGGRTLRPFVAVELVPLDFTTAHINKLFVGESDTEVRTIGSRGFATLGSVSLFCINERWQGREQYLSALDRADAICLLLQNYLTDCVDPLGRVAWSELTPLPKRVMPERRLYGGIELPFEVLQSAGNNPWAV